MDYIDPILLILGGILAISGLIVAKKPDAKAMIEKLTPYQAGIGLALLVFGVYNVFHIIIAGHLFTIIKIVPVLALVALVVVIASVLLGLMFGMPMLARFSASGAAKGEEMAKKLAPFQTLIGLVGIIAGLVYILFVAGILKPM